MYFCICTDNGRNIIGEIKTEEEKKLTAQDIIKLQKLSTNTIWIRTEHCVYSLKDTDQPFINRPELISTTRPGFWDSPTTSLFIISKDVEPNSVFLFLSAKQNTSLNFPRLHILVPGNYMQSNIIQLYKIIEDTFPSREKLLNTFKDSVRLKETFLTENGKLPDKDVNFESILINDQKVEDKTPINEIFDKLKEGNEVSIVFKISKMLETYLDYRKKTVDDFIGSEKRFVDDLTALNQDWKDQLKRQHFFTDYDFNLLFQDIPTIITFHKQLLSILSSKNEGYATQFSKIFLEQGPFFKISSNFISNYPEILEILKNAHLNSEYTEFCKQYSEKYKGLHFESFLITPVQRIARYNLLLKDLKSKTLSNHPDFVYIDSAIKLMLNITNEVDKRTGYIQSQKVLTDIQMKNSGDFEYLKSDRRVIKQFDTLIQSRNLPGTFVVCNDYIFLIDNLDSFCRFMCPLKAVPIAPLKDKVTIRILSPDYDDTYFGGNDISFSTQEDCQEFLSLITIVKVV